MQEFYHRTEVSQIVSNLVILMMESMEEAGISAEKGIEVLEAIDQKLMDKIFKRIVNE